MRIAIAAAVLAIAAVSCTKTNPSANAKQVFVPKPSAAALPPKVAFVPPADSSVSPQRLHSWLSCNGNLDSLSVRYIDSFKVADQGQRLVLQKHFADEQDKVCIRAGLRSGYEEYLWILKNRGNPKNKAMFDSLATGGY